MITIYHASNIDAVNWKIYVDNINNDVKYFSTGTKATELADQLCQCSLFDNDNANQVSVVNIDNWKLTDEPTFNLLFIFIILLIYLGNHFH